MKQGIQIMSVVVVLALVAVVGFLLGRVTAPGGPTEVVAEEEETQEEEVVDNSHLYFDTPEGWDYSTLVTQTGENNEVSLTFDDGPSEFTPQVLDILNQYDIKATFCPLGMNVEAMPEMAQRMVDEGHQICNHSFYHSRATNIGPTQGIIDEMNLANQTYKDVLGVEKVNWYRAPEGVFNPSVTAALEETDMMALFWGVDSWDWRQPGVDGIVNNVMTTVGPESVILFHDGGGNRSQTVAALPIIIEQLLARGYTFTVPMEKSRSYTEIVPETSETTGTTSESATTSSATTSSSTSTPTTTSSRYPDTDETVRGSRPE